MLSPQCERACGGSVTVEFAKWRALRAHVPKYILQTGKLKISVLMKSNEGSFTAVFKGAEF